MAKPPTSGRTNPGVLKHIASGVLATPEFRPLRALATVDNEDELRAEMLARLDDIYDRAIKRERTVGKDQHVVLDPDGNTATKVVEVAASILGVKVKVRQPGGSGNAFDPTPFAAPLKEVS